MAAKQVGYFQGLEKIGKLSRADAQAKTIEAARAGEQGRGFAVVVEEVRNLARRTSLATEEITSMITSIQNDTGSVVVSMNAVTPQVMQGGATGREGGGCPA
nr:methyl-accepting chemotaxis protein [Pseudomonas fuscovaginae]